MECLASLSDIGCLKDSSSSVVLGEGDSKNIYKILGDRRVVPACSFGGVERRVLSSSAVGLFLGGPLAVLGTTTGPLVGLHEVVGHGLVGYQMTHVAVGPGPTYQVDGWDNFRVIGKADSVGGGFIDFFRWIGGYDRNGDGFAGYAQYPPKESDLNGIGKAMGAEGQSAWVSIAGSLPGIALDTLAVVGGLSLRKKFPFLGTMIATFGLTDHLTSSYYPITAAVMSSQELQSNASRGHDFANFAVQMSSITGLSAQAIAISTASIWTLIVPLIGVLTYLHTKSHIADIVPDVLAMKHWIDKATSDEKVSKELQRLFDAYPYKKDLREIFDEVDFSVGLEPDTIEAIQGRVLDFIDYLLQKVSSKSLDLSKKEILAGWNKDVSKDRIESGLMVTSVVGTASAIASKILRAVAPSCGSSVQTAASVLTNISPIFIFASVASAGYQVYKDFKSSDSIVPRKAKMISVARLIIAIVSAVLVITSLFVPGLNIAFFAVLIIGTIANISLSFARARTIKKQFELAQALEPNTFDTMRALWRYHQTKAPGTKMTKSLQKWVDCLRHHNKIHLLNIRFETISPVIAPDIKPPMAPTPTAKGRRTVATMPVNPNGLATDRVIKIANSADTIAPTIPPPTMPIALLRNL